MQVVELKFWQDLLDEQMGKFCNA